MTSTAIGNNTYLDVARRGYEFLATEGVQWDFEVSRLNPDTLDISSGVDCALSQAGACHYWTAVKRLAIEGFPVADEEALHQMDLAEAPVSATFLWERWHGFRHGPGVRLTFEAYDELTQAWRQVVKEARDGA